MATALSLVLCARNDQYRGNSLWRLNTALNYVALRAEALGYDSRVELLIVDWGSTDPLSEAVQLCPAAARMTRFLWVPPERTKALQRDSPFAEVLALNAGIRRAAGDYVGRIDQDTLVGERFLSWFFEEYLKGDTDISPSAILMSNRRGIPFRYATLCPAFASVERYVARRGGKLPLAWPKPEHLYYRSPIGLLVMHRDLWHDCRGYDETMIYFNYMEWDLILRLMERYPFVNLGRVVDHDFYHLDHEHPLARLWAGRSARKMNPARDETDNPPPLFAPNSEEWGLVQEDRLSLDVAEPSESWRVAGGTGHGASRFGDAAVNTRSRLARGLDALLLGGFHVTSGLVRATLKGLPGPIRRRANAIGEALAPAPLYRWPSIVFASVFGLDRRSETVTDPEGSADINSKVLEESRGS